MYIYTYMYMLELLLRISSSVRVKLGTSLIRPTRNLTYEFPGGVKQM